MCKFIFFVGIILGRHFFFIIIIVLQSIFNARVGKVWNAAAGLFAADGLWL